MERRLLGDVEEKQLKVDIRKEYRYVVPSVRLERRNISMLNPPSSHVSAPTLASASDSPTENVAKTRIVGEKGPPEEDGSQQATTTTTTTITKRQTQEDQPEGTRTKELRKTEETSITATQEQPIQETKEPSFMIEEQAKELQQETNREQSGSATRLDTEDESGATLEASGASSSRTTMHFSQQFPKEESAQILEFFEEQGDHSLEEGSPSLLAVPAVHAPPQKSPRSPSPSSLHASVGLSHLDNLIRLMEQLSTLRDENQRLRKKCDYLETTKQLLQARNELVLVDPQTGSYRLLPAKQKHKAGHEKRKDKTSHAVRPRLPSAEDVQCMDISESTSDHRPERPKGSMHKRSFSTGSLEVEILDETSASHGREVLISKSKSGKNILGSKSPGSKQKGKSSKWARVKKVLTGQKLYEDLGTTIRSLKELGRSAQRYPSVSATHDFSPPSQRVAENRSLDSGVSTSLDTDTPTPTTVSLARMSTSSTEPSSVGRSPNQTGDGGVEELGTEIWMGPPGWWEQYEARKQSEASSSDVSSVIEVKTMYLGSSKPPPSQQQQQQLKDTDRLLKVKPLIRRQSSPSLSSKDVEGGKDKKDSEEAGPVHRSSSCKGEDLDLPKDGALGKGERDGKKIHRTAWGRVKDMIHVRKDSVKKRSSPRDRERDGPELSSQGEEVSEGDVEALAEEHWSGEFAEGVMSRSTPRTSPIVVPRQGGGVKSCSESPPQITLDASPPSRMASSAGSAEMAALLAGSLSEKFTQKMLEWQEIQLKKSSSFKTTPTEGEGEALAGNCAGDNQELLASQTQDATDKAKTKGALQQSSEIPPESTLPELTPFDLLGPSVNVEELQRRISESFSRKLAEWERRKYRRPDTPDMERRGSGRGRKGEREERGRSKKSREEKAREREMQKVEREQVKLEKEKVRLEKERLRALERQAKLERMKGRLSQADAEAPLPSPGPLTPTGTMFPPSPGPGPAADDLAGKYRMSADFARKLQEWEMMRGAAGQESGLPLASPGGPAGGQGRPPPLALKSCMDSPEETSPVDRTSDISYGDDASVTDEHASNTKIASLERANNRLLAEVSRKEQEYRDLQDEVTRLSTKLDKVRHDHAAEMVRFRRDLEQGIYSGPVALEVGDLESTVRELEDKISQMETAGDQLAESMESAAIAKWQSVEGEEAVSHELVSMVDQMRTILVQAAHTRESVPSVQQANGEEVTQKTVALQNFEKVYSQAMKLQVQMNNLRVSQLERNKEIMLIKRQLLLQEVNNVLLQAHITRREVELYQYREARRHAAVKRWSTFSSSDRMARVPGVAELRPPLLRKNSAHDPDLQAVLPPAKTKNDIPNTSDKETGVPAMGMKMENGKVRTRLEAGPLDVSADDSTGPAYLTSAHPPTPVASDVIPSAAVPRPVSAHASPLLSARHVEGATGRGQTTSGERTVSSTSLDRLHRPASEKTDAKTSASDVSNVARGSPRLLAQTIGAREIPAGVTAVTVPSCKTGRTIPARKAELPDAKTEIPGKLIPQRPESDRGGDPLSASAALGVTENYSPTEPVMKCTESDRDVRHLQGSRSEDAEGVDIASRDRPEPARSTPPDQKRFPERKEESDRDKRVTSPSAKAVGTAKPPLPRQSTPQSPPTSQRSKSVDSGTAAEGGGRAAPSTAARDVAASRLEKRATVCETEERKLEFRKTPSPTLHLPRVGLVSRVRRLKPAAELLQESQRYRSGHTVYATRIMQRYLPAQSPAAAARPPPTAAAAQQDKEKDPGPSYVQAIVQKFSREATPGSGSVSSGSSSLSLHKTDSPRAPSEFVSDVIHKLSSSGGPETHKPQPAPLQELSNEGQVKKLTKVFSVDDEYDDESARALPERSRTDADALDRTDRGGHSPPTSVSRAFAPLETKPESTISPTSHASMPALASGQSLPLAADGARERAATYCVSDAERPRSFQLSANGESIEQIGEDFLDPMFNSEEANGRKISPSSSTKSKNTLCCQSSSCTRSKCSTETNAKPKLPSSPKSQERKGGNERKETIGVLCKQSMSFDLGVSLKAQPIETFPSTSVEAAVPGQGKDSPSEGTRARRESTSSEGERMGSPPRPSTDDKKKSRNRFLDSSWLQKPRKFFKVSK